MVLEDRKAGAPTPCHHHHHPPFVSSLSKDFPLSFLVIERSVESRQLKSSHLDSLWNTNIPFKISRVESVEKPFLKNKKNETFIEIQL